MKYFLPIIMLLATFGFSFGQTYSITPNDTVEVTGYLEDLQTLTISQLNTSNDSLYFEWKKVSESVPGNWEASVCDNFVCYTVLQDSGLTNPVLPAESGFILLHVTPHVTYGTCVVRYAIWDRANPAVKDTLTFITKALEPSSLPDFDLNTFSLFPNPTTDVLNVHFSDNQPYRVVILNSIGEAVYTGAATSNFQLYTANLPGGTYSVSIFTNDSFKVTQKLIIQN